MVRVRIKVRVSIRVRVNMKSVTFVLPRVGPGGIVE